MATIVNDRDVLLQAASPRVVPPSIQIEQVEGLLPAIRGIRIVASAVVFGGSSGTTSPATITLTAERLNGVTGPVVWSILSGSATVSPVGDVCTITGSTMVGQSLVVRARVTEGSTNYDQQITITKLGALSLQATVNLSSQVTGQLANSNVSGLGALALLGNVNLENVTQVKGDLVATRVAAGTFVAGVVYAGIVNVNQLVGVDIIGKNLAGGNFLLLGSTSAVTAPVRFSLITDGVPANGANGFFRGNFRAESLSGALSLEVNNSVVNLNANSGTASLTAPRSGGGTNLVQASAAGVVISGDVTLTSNDLTFNASTLNIAASSLTGSMGARIILKNVSYTCTVNGTPGNTVVFTA